VLAERHGERRKALQRKPQDHRRDDNDSPKHEFQYRPTGHLAQTIFSSLLRQASDS
jgi:hypothetical protein